MVWIATIRSVNAASASARGEGWVWRCRQSQNAEVDTPSVRHNTVTG